LGELFIRVGQTEDAFQQYERSHAILAARAKAILKSDKAKRNVAISLMKLGDMSQQLRRDMKAALSYYQQALQLYEDLHQHPYDGTENPDFKEDPAAIRAGLALMDTKVGAALFDLGNPAGALEYFRKALDLNRALAAADPKNPLPRLSVA